MENPPRLTHDDYTVACICPMGVELAPLEAMLDEIHESLPQVRDVNGYTLGRIGVHNVVIAVLPEIGNNCAANVATQLLNDFKSIRFGLLVGIGGGVPSDENDIRLGDVVVGMPVGTFGGVVQLDRGKVHPGGRFERTGALNKPPAVLLANVRRLEGQHNRIGNQIPKYVSEMLKKYPELEEKGYVYPGMEYDQLFKTDNIHKSGKTCQLCDLGDVVQRDPRKDTIPRVHYGTIGSANEVIKDSETRENLRKDLGILCVEMEAAGLMDDFSCLVIRGICDYADSHKNKKWQPYAAAVAAAYTKELLSIIPAQEMLTIDKASNVIHMAKGTPLEYSSALVKRFPTKDLVECLSSYDHEYAHDQLSKKRHDGTGTWILQNADFNIWWESASASIWCSGIPGAGKTILTTFVVDEVEKLSSKYEFFVLYVYCDRANVDTLIASSVLGSFVKQLLFYLDRLKLPWPSVVRDELELRFNQGRKYLSPHKLSEMLLQLLPRFDKTIIFVDGLDECAPDESKRILQSLEHLVCDQSTKLHVFVASRKETDVSQFLSGCLNISVSKENIASDIRLYVEKEVEINIADEGRTKSSTVIEDIKETLIKGSQGMFLWVELQIQAIIADCNTDEQIRESLRRLPTSLAETYLRCLLRIKKRRPGDLEVAPKILKWVAFSNHPLNLDEIKEAIAFSPEDVRWNSSKVPNTISNCGNLLVFEDDGAVRLAHGTVRQYLLSKKLPSTKVDDVPLEEQERILQKFSFKQEQAELEIGEVCVTYVSFLDFGDRQLREAETKDFTVSNIIPPVANLPALGIPGLNRILKKAFPKSSKAKKTITLSQNNNFSSTSLKYKLFEYAKIHWALHTTSITEISPVWDRFKTLALTPNRSWNFQPWIKHAPSNQDYYKSLLQWAINAQHIPLLSLLQSLPSGSRLCDLSKQSLLNGQLPLYYAAENNRDRSVEYLLRYCKANAKDDNGETALYCAARQGHKAVVKVLLTSREIKVDARANNELTPLMCTGEPEIARLLLVKGADVEAKTNNGFTALHHAAKKGYKAVVQLLLENGADVEAKTNNGNRALHYAADQGHGAVVQLLLKNGADIEAKTNNGDTAMHHAVDQDYGAVVQVLLKNGADVEAKTSNGDTTLYVAAYQGYRAVVQLLLEKGADVKAKTSSGNTALHCAADRGHRAVVQLLLEKGADVEAKNNGGSTALHNAAANGHGAVVQLLLEKGADTKAKNNGGSTALHNAAANGHGAAVQLLLENGADVEAKNENGNRALHDAAVQGHGAVVQLLLEKGADVEAKSNDGDTALHRAAYQGHGAAVQLLLENGADAKARSKDGSTPFSLARGSGHVEVVELLR